MTGEAARGSPGSVLASVPVLRVFAAWGATRTLRYVAAVALVAAMAWVVATAQPWTGDPTTWIHDAQYYYGAGERLNAGHLLYAYSPGDRQLAVDPFYFAGPFLYPPLLGVLWRPVAAVVPYGVAVTAFWAIGLIVFLGTLAWLLRRGGAVTAIGVLVLVVPLSWTAWSGNVSTLMVPVVIWSWLALGRARDRAAGAVVGVMAVMKLTPAFLVWWMLVTKRWRAAAAAIIAGVVALAVSIAGAGPGSLADYLRVSGLVGRTGGTEASLTSLLAGMGAGPDTLALVAPVVAVIGAVAVALLRRRPRVAWAVAIATGVFASPVFNLTNVSLLLAAFVALDPAIAVPAIDGDGAEARVPAAVVGAIA